MKLIIVLASFIAVASAGHLGGYGAPAALVPTGASTQFRSQDNYGNYEFGYDESHATGGSSRREAEHNGVRRGSYSLSDADGRRRTVDYVADAYGFRASVNTNEPGVEPKDPAAVLINKNGYAHAAGPVVAGPAYAAPVAAPIVAAAPVAASYAAPVATGYAAAPVAAGYSAPAQAGYGYEAPRAFSYSFGATHVAPVAAPVYSAPAPAYAAGPVYSDRAAAY